MGWGYVIVGYVMVVSVIAAYSLWLMQRGRKLSQQVPPEKRRFLD